MNLNISMNFSIKSNKIISFLKDGKKNSVVFKIRLKLLTNSSK